MRGSGSLRMRSSGRSMTRLYAGRNGPASAAVPAEPVGKLLRLALGPHHVLAVERHGRDRHLRRAVLHLARMREIDQRLVLLVVDAVHHLLLPDQAEALLE